MAGARIYFDHNATTPLDPAVVEAMAEAMRDTFGNPSSVHHFGQRAKAALDGARAAVAALIGGQPDEIVFTSGGSEADNFALRGVAEALAPTGRKHFVASVIEHEAVLNTLKALERRGWTTTLLPVTSDGLVEADALRASIAPETALVSVMHANNEIGTIQPIGELAAIAHAQGALFHTDAVQSVGKIPIDVRALGVDLLSLSGHKNYGPKGIGALWIRRGTRVSATITGGRQEKNRRAGTENVPAIVGLGVAARIALERLQPGAEEGARIAALRDRLEVGVERGVSGVAVSGAAAARVPNTSNISFEGIEAESLLIALDLEGVAVSTGSACSSGTLEPSHVLQAMGYGATRARSSLRFSLGHGNTTSEVDRVVELLPRLVERLRAVTDQRAQHEAVLNTAGRAAL
ncbi:MAG: aminotransferase class V-fold PLP-dependent enzyme [Luteitalea sp.]|nr:aminotransferase class V-fold PLP-dependent enzyme [Luteitalea sp.]